MNSRPTFLVHSEINSHMHEPSTQKAIEFCFGANSFFFSRPSFTPLWHTCGSLPQALLICA